MSDPAHEVMVLCDCGDIEACRMERYVSDVRILKEELDAVSAPGHEVNDGEAKESG